MNKADDTMSLSQKAMELITAEDDGRVCQDIPDSACSDQAGNFIIHVTSLAMSKIADLFINPKIILSWLLVHSGTPTAFIAFLVPVREAGALLPQLFIAEFVRSRSIRKWVWATGCFLQSIAAMGMVLSAVFFEGVILGYSVLVCLAFLAIARSFCSVSYKDVLGKTISKSKRGTTTGLASSVAALIGMLFALLLMSGYFQTRSMVLCALAIASLCWLIAAFVFSRLQEVPGATDGGKNAFSHALSHFNALYTDRELRLYIVSRSLLIATALAPPFLIASQSNQDNQSLNALGSHLLASSLAGICSSYVWGRLSDYSSRLCMMIAGLLAGTTLIITAIYLQISSSIETSYISVLLFFVMIAYEGVRLSRSTHLVDLADTDRRAIYTAISNTIIGLLLLASSLFSVIASWFGSVVVIEILAAMCLLSIISSCQMQELQNRKRS